MTARVTARVAPAGDRTSLGVTITTAIDLRVPHLDQGHAGRAQNGAGSRPGPESPPCPLVAATQDQAGRLARRKAALPVGARTWGRTAAVSARPLSAAGASIALRPHGSSTGSPPTYTSKCPCTAATRQGELDPRRGGKPSRCTETHIWPCGHHLWSAQVLCVRLLQLIAEEVPGPLLMNFV